MSEYLKVLLECHKHPKAFQSDYARYCAGYIAEAASRGHITSVINGLPTARWYVTAEGLKFLQDNGMEV